MVVVAEKKRHRTGQGREQLPNQFEVFDANGHKVPVVHAIEWIVYQIAGHGHEIWIGISNLSDRFCDKVRHLPAQPTGYGRSPRQVVTKVKV